MFRNFIHQHAGIDLSPAKKVMVGGRLQKRVNHYQLASYEQYYHMATHPDNDQELQLLVDILTTNETYFFREPKHFTYFEKEILGKWKTGHFKVWSAASSSGEEAYSLAMLLAEKSGTKTWDILATDLNRDVLTKASRGIYGMNRVELLDPYLMNKYCLKGVRSQQGLFCIADKLKQKVSFHRLNLTLSLPRKIAMFDVIFLRNVLIYFNNETKKKVVEQLISKLKPGGYFFISHSETLSRVTDKLVMVKPSIYRKK
ncbi:CheR family methyltransferase [Psychromonas aquimarina]|uniref:CheR family methyltransferase n=1 Tax=Psychromonas aquimarina TaxID=444919 RepID=UPI0024812894|nr:protein-glutamate O-methyltransferase CheR [Psychromonas aquimarina]